MPLGNNKSRLDSARIVILINDVRFATRMCGPVCASASRSRVLLDLMNDDDSRYICNILNIPEFCIFRVA